MATIVLISCVAKKLPHSARAEELYTSSLFQKNLAYARQLQPDAIFILSAKYGLLALDTIVAPYDQTLNHMSVLERRKWASVVLSHLKKVANLDVDQFVFLAGNRYREFLLPYLRYVHVPLEGLPIGKQLHQLEEWLQNE